MKQKLLAKVSPEGILVFVLLMLNIFFLAFHFFPTLRDINLWDEAVYINRGRMLVQGMIPQFSDNPLLALLFGISYLPFQRDGFWLIHTAGVGRILMFILMWTATYLIAKQIPGLKWGTMIGLMFISSLMADILENPSDAFFAGLSALAFWQMLCYHNRRQIKHLGFASLSLGMAAMARNDGLVLFGIFLLVILIVYMRTAEDKWRCLAAAVMPFLILVGGYLLLYGGITGVYDLGTQERSYLAFRQGQMELYVPDPTCAAGPVKCAGYETDRLYGTAAENNNSIFRAIAHNPHAYFQRLLKTVLLLPSLAAEAYGQDTFYALVFLAVAGLFALMRRKDYSLLWLSLAWTIPLAAYFLTFFRAGYLRLPFFILYVPASLGIQELVESIGQKRCWIWVLILLALTGMGLMFSSNTLYFSTMILLACMGLGYLLIQGNFNPSGKNELTLMLFLAGGLIMRGGFPLPAIPTPGAYPEEKAVMTLERRFPENALVGAGAPGIPFEARMKFIQLTDKDLLQNAGSPEEYYTNLKKMDVRAIYVDNIILDNAALWELIQPGIGRYYEQVYSGRGDSILVLLVK